MKVSIQSLGTRHFNGPSATLAAVATSLLLLTGACNDSGSNGSAPFTATATGGTAAAPTVSTAAGATATPATPRTAAGAVAPPTTTAAAGSGATTASPTAAAGTGVATGAAGAATGAAGGGAAAPSGPATFTAVLAILADTKNNCGTCHKSAAVGGGLMFDPADKAGTYAALVGPKSMGTNGSTCGGKTYVVPGKPDDSLLYDKVSKAMPMCGLRMPASGVVLEDSEIATIKGWIAAGAMNN